MRRLTNSSAMPDQQTSASPSARPGIGCSDLLSALRGYEQRRGVATDGFYTLRLWSDGSGRLLDVHQAVIAQFDNEKEALTVLSG